MHAVRRKHLELLQPFLVGDKPTKRGEDNHLEWDMYCPLHDDEQRSAGINLDAGVWFCQAGCGGGKVAELIDRKDEWRDTSPPPRSSTTHENVTDDQVREWAETLLADDEAMDGLTLKRGLAEDIIREYELGWNNDKGCYAIPIRDADGELVNVRWYTLSPASGRRKIWSVTGMGKPTLYPVQVLDHDPKSIIVCEGELDALLTIQNGYSAITRTGSAATWNPEWGEHFKDRVVYLCHDMDATGQDANRKIGRSLHRVAKDVRVLLLPYQVAPKHGKDLTDFWLEHTREDFKELLRQAKGETKIELIKPEDEVAVIDSFDSRKAGDALRLTVTVNGKREPGYSIPREAVLRCTRDAGNKCNVCPLYPAQGEDMLVVRRNDPMVLALQDSSWQQAATLLRESYGAPKCSKLQIDVTEYQAVELLTACPNVDHANGRSEDYKNIGITSIGRHTTMPNSTIEVTGALQPAPRSHNNTFQAWGVKKLRTSIDDFPKLDVKTIKLLERFRPARGERPIKKLGRISRDVAHHVTKIYGRPELHAAMDLVWHSALAFDFGDDRVRRGWLELLVVGDTRTGKSEAADRLSRHYQAGEVVSCESASFAGVIGGLQQLGGTQWTITWGAIPLNDRRLVVLDEVGGLSTEAISTMSSVRSSGTAEITKIQKERTYARTRLVWLGNPRDSRMGDFTHGVQAIPPLIGNAEDIARFDFAMCVREGEVAAEDINREHATGKRLPYTTEACSTLVRWVWSRTPEQIKWARGAEQAVYNAAIELGARYIPEPPLVQAADVRVKIARLSVALAARLFSTDAKHECIVVHKEHVEDAVKFLDLLYNLSGFGYAELSKKRIRETEEARTNWDVVKEWLTGKQGLVSFLQGTSKFRRQDIEEILNVEGMIAIGIISQLHDWKMVTKAKGDVIVTPTLNEILRGM